MKGTFERYMVSKDQNACMGQKSKDSKFFGYKTHIAMTEEWIITSEIVSSGKRGDRSLLQVLIEDSIKKGLEVALRFKSSTSSFPLHLPVGFALLSLTRKTVSNKKL